MSNSSVEIHSSRFDCNNANRLTNVISGSHLLLAHSNFTNNTGSDKGTVVDSSAGVVNIVDCQMTNNQGNNDGGIVYSLNSNISIWNSTFGQNQAEGFGGVISVEGKGSYLQVAMTSFVDNHAEGHGSAICAVQFADIALDSSTLIGNTASLQSSIYVSDIASLRISNCYIDMPEKQYGLYFDSDLLTLTDFMTLNTVLTKMGNTLSSSSTNNFLEEAKKLAFISIINEEKNYTVSQEETPYASGNASLNHKNLGRPIGIYR